MRRIVLVTLALCLGCERPASNDVPAVAPAAAAPPSVLLVSFDTTRPDALGVYGSDGGHTPTMDEVARAGTVFENVIAPMGATFPSHASMLTGLNPRQHGVRANHDKLQEGTVTLAETLRTAGYDTAAFVSFGSMVSRGGLHQGFDDLSDPATGGSTGGIRDGDEITKLAVEWLAGPRERPFFLWLHYFEAHAPYRVTPYARERLADYAGPLAEGADVNVFYSLGKKIPWSAEERLAVRVLYDGEVRELDRLIAPVLEELAATGLADETIVVLTADHGQALGENGVVGHGLSLDEIVLRVPLIIRDPRNTDAPRRVEGRVGVVDLAPTLLELVGQSAPEDIDGRSLAGALRGEPLEDRLYFAEMNEPLWDKDPTEIRRRDVAVYEGDVKAVHDRKGSRAFDLAADPLAQSPLPAESRPQRVAELEALAEAYHVGRRDHSGQVKDPAVAEELRALGYLE
ncbi:MAG: sulfatase [Candidatus Binatia bacterium]|nr:sulfatase [Candidatus Binatia bacterium]